MPLVETAKTYFALKRPVVSSVRIVSSGVFRNRRSSCRCLASRQIWKLIHKYYVKFMSMAVLAQMAPTRHSQNWSVVLGMLLSRKSTALAVRVSRAIISTWQNSLSLISPPSLLCICSRNRKYISIVFALPVIRTLGTPTVPFFSFIPLYKVDSFRPTQHSLAPHISLCFVRKVRY